jgi:FkbM family methyltransferase
MAPTLNWFDPARLEKEDPEEFKQFFGENYVLAELNDDEELKGRHVLDVGANNGYFTMRSMVAGAKSVVAVEPSPVTFQKLHRNIKDIPGVTGVNAAVFDGVERWTTITDQNKHSKTGKWSDAQGEKDLGGAEAIKIRSLSIGELLSFFPSDDNSLVLKLDTEGAEYDIMLATAARDIRRFEWIYLEVHPISPALPEHPARNKQYLEDYMNLMGYELKHRGTIFWWSYDGEGNVLGCEPNYDLQCLKLKRI